MTDDHRRHGANLQTKPHQQLDSPQSRPDPEVVCDAKKRKHKKHSSLRRHHAFGRWTPVMSTSPQLALRMQRLTSEVIGPLTLPSHGDMTL